MPNKALRIQVITLDDGNVTEVQSDIVDESLHGQVQSEERDAVRVNADSESKRGSLENERELVFEIPSVLAGEKGELDNTRDATPASTLTVSTVASAEDMQNILAV
jgi:hypothetical protein